MGATAVCQDQFVIWTTFENVSFSACCEFKYDIPANKLLVVTIKNKSIDLIDIELPKGEIVGFEEIDYSLIYKTCANRIQVIVPQEWNLNRAQPTPKSLLLECYLDNQEIYTFCHQNDFLIILGKSHKPECVSLRYKYFIIKY